MRREVSKGEIVLFPVQPYASANSDCLSETEQSAAQRKRQGAVRDAYVSCRTVLRHILARHLSCEASSVPIHLTEKGKPFVPDCDLSVSISHAKGLSLVAVARNKHIGVDLEPAGRKVDVDMLARNYLSASEKKKLLGAVEPQRTRLFLNDWVCREALVKATGQGLEFPASQIEPHEPSINVMLFEGIPNYITAIAHDGSRLTVRLEKPHRTF